MESGLTLKKVDFEIKVSRIVGYPIGIANVGYPIGKANGGDRDPTAKQAAIVQDCVESGLRRFYFCTPPWNWSFLRPFATLLLAEGETTIDLPGDFGGFEGRIAVSDDADGVFRPVEVINVGSLQQMYSEAPTATGQPQSVAIRPLKGTSRHSGQRSELFFFPEADGDYFATFQYYLLPGLPDVTNPFPYGGGEHSETILESCLAVMEERYDNVIQGPHAIAFARQLVASQSMDRRKKEQVIGYNGDNSDRRARLNFDNLQPVLYNSVDFTGENP